MGIFSIMDGDVDLGCSFFLAWNFFFAIFVFLFYIFLVRYFFLGIQE